VIGQVQKSTEEILEMLDGKEKLVLYGCGGCATVFHTGGEPEVKEMAYMKTPIDNGTRSEITRITTHQEYE
jgi:hypothetical protein